MYSFAKLQVMIVVSYVVVFMRYHTFHPFTPQNRHCCGLEPGTDHVNFNLPVRYFSDFFETSACVRAGQGGVHPVG